MNRTLSLCSRLGFLRLPVAALFLLLPLPGCGPTITVPAITQSEVPQLEELGNYPHLNYRIEPGDLLNIDYTFHPEMKQAALVQPDGKISATLLGDIVVAGLTTGELGKLLVERTSSRLRNPEVVVGIEQYAPKNVHVLGEVGKPGLVPYQKDLTPLQAIATAGGFLNTAMPESVILVRTGGGDEVVTRKLNLLETVTNGVKEPLHLAPHDIVFVPKTGIANADLWVKQHVSDLLPVPASYRIAP